MFKNIKWEWLVIAGLVGIVIFLTTGKDDVKIITKEIPIKIEIPIPAKEGKLDTVYLPSPTKYIENPLNQELALRYKEAKDSLAKLKVFNEAIIEREYSEVYEDSIVKTTVYTRTQGKLLKQAVKYLVKPSTVKVDTVVKTEIKIPKKNELYYGVDSNFNIKDLTKTSFGASILLKNKKDKIFQIGVGVDDIERGLIKDNLYIKGGIYYKF